MLMIKPIVCDNCNKEVKKLPFELNWKYKSEECRQCRHTEDLYRRYEFCSPRCLSLWSQKFNGHKHQWTISPLGNGAFTKKGKVLSVMAHCKICKAQDWHNKDKKLIEKYEKWHKPYLALSAELNKNDNTRRSKKSIHKPKK